MQAVPGPDCGEPLTTLLLGRVSQRAACEPVDTGWLLRPTDCGALPWLVLTSGLGCRRSLFPHRDSATVEGRRIKRGGVSSRSSDSLGCGYRECLPSLFLHFALRIPFYKRPVTESPQAQPGL